MSGIEAQLLEMTTTEQVPVFRDGCITIGSGRLRLDDDMIA